jgi:protein-disulfide isomerase
MISRRLLVLGTLAAAPARAAGTDGSASNQWFALRGDEGQPVPNLRAPGELIEDIEELQGAIWSGPASASVKLVEFYDYNCPWCRAANMARGALQRSQADLRVGLVNNPILSVASAQAAKVDLAVLRRHGAKASFALHEALFARPGRIDGPRALEMVASLGHDRAEIERLADARDTAALLRTQMSLASSLGIMATPSYVVGGAVVLGYPGPNTLKRIVANAGSCGTPIC